MSAIGRYLVDLGYAYLESHPDLTWEEVMKIICEGGNDSDENTEQELCLH